jgi:hypothetical protein
MNVDPQAFLDQTIQGANSTTRIPIPVGDYPCIIKDIAYRTIERKDQPGAMSHVLDVVYAIDDANVREVTGLPQPTVRQTCWLDLTDEGKLDMSKGKNVDLGRLREALGLNDPSVPFSFNQLKGQACFVKVVQNPSKDGKETYANVDRVGKTAA